MAKPAHYIIYDTTAQLPDTWDVLAQRNIFLSSAYLSVLEQSAPQNLNAHFIGLYQNNALAGIAVAQYINLDKVNTFAPGERGFCFKEYLFKKFASQVLVIGNNMLTGQNAYVLNGTIDEVTALKLLEGSIKQLKGHYRKNHVRINILAIKDFSNSEWPAFDAAGFKGYYRFCTQPNMVFDIRANWQSIDDYLLDLSTKYRTQYNRARKKAAGIEKRKLSAEDIQEHNECIQRLYITVAGNASFNTFHLPENHFYTFKKALGENFLFYGYFLDGKLIGFNTLIKNGADMDTYFLGYDAALQKEKMLYLNMLYDMAGYAMKKQFSHIIYGRSAMEIKSSVGARAENVYGLIKHTNPLINFFRKRIFTYFDPVVTWHQRNPFKN
ncbi:8-amino-7-oxononanoate synthase [Flavobacterium sp. RHBU_24]|uniref:8-amino-7-oxononanoate synthase n=1 Tax=Flavobacterium sp. RHBU_24 TaxID=3391185 RepID=UPI003984EE79